MANKAYRLKIWLGTILISFRWLCEITASLPNLREPAKKTLQERKK
jgi:hypothetical protein